MNQLQKAIKARDEFLAANPHLQGYQDEINRILDATDESQRIEVLGMMMSGKLLEQQAKLVELVSLVNEKMNNG